MVLLQRKYFPKDPEGVQHFPGGGGGRVQMLISIETYITFDFPGSAWTTYRPSGSAHENLRHLHVLCIFQFGHFDLNKDASPDQDYFVSGSRTGGPGLQVCQINKGK